MSFGRPQMPLTLVIWRFSVLFYTSLLLTSILLTLVILGLKNLIVFAFRKLADKGREAVRGGSVAHLSHTVPGPNIHAASSAWGRQNHATPATEAKTHPAVPTYAASSRGWSGTQHESREKRPRPTPANAGTLNAYLARKYDKEKPAADWRRNIGRPLRDDGSTLSGQAYKPSEDAISKYGIDNQDDRPWGW